MKITPLFAALSLCLVGCGNNDSAPNNKSAQPAIIATPDQSAQQTHSKIVAAIKLSDMDVRYIKGELDEDSFDQLILKGNPDIGRVKYQPRANEDRDDIANSKREFRRALYFAKKIPLANGQTMFDWLKSCPYSMGENMYASRVPVATGAYESFASNLSFMDATYHPILSMKGYGNRDDISLSWIIYEDGAVKAFTSRALVYLSNPNFETESATDCRQ
ncbi:hypothetical protein [Undibacterium luofuense]|uniref:Uncharacterized protein n=1 Tax=Undibacterium luofuense TaxID=2828733 RepID=A0A941I6A4_9BURK|nr:hypothetical protein [Undibacterium luofuense]MBR7783672.1 hypothetical protein [Undibacterium luofuense]